MPNRPPCGIRPRFFTLATIPYSKLDSKLDTIPSRPVVHDYLVGRLVRTPPGRGRAGQLTGRPAGERRDAVSPRSVAVATALVIGAFSAGSSRAQQLPPSIEFRVPKPPTVAIASTGGFVAYELHVTNLLATPFTLTRVEVLDGGSGRAIHTIADSTLLRDINRPGQTMPPAERSRIGGGLRAVVYVWAPVDAAAAPVSLRHRLTFHRDSAGAAPVILEGAVVPVTPQSAPIGAPLRGEWVAVNGPSQASGHRRLVMALNGTLASGQRFGADFLQVGEGGTFTGDRTKNENYLAYGEEILAVADGSVVATKDSIPENVPGGRAVPITLETVGGNYILIDIGDGRYAFYAHVVPGSLRVRVGDRVRRGQVVAFVGNSGNSTEPHLHFHIVDGIAEGTTTLGAEGIPYALEQFELLGRCTSFTSATGCERAAPVTVQRGIPLQNQIVRFR
jgi:murein DD-endopeptidase